MPDDVKRLYKTAWELSQKALVDLSAARGPFIDQSQSLNCFIAEPDYGKLTTYPRPSGNSRPVHPGRPNASEARRGDAAAATWIFRTSRGDATRTYPRNISGAGSHVVGADVAASTEYPRGSRGGAATSPRKIQPAGRRDLTSEETGASEAGSAGAPRRYHFRGWEAGLKTGMYYLRTKPAANALQFTLDPDKAGAGDAAPAVDDGRGSCGADVCLSCSG